MKHELAAAESEVTSSQRKIIAQDYAMKHGQISVPVRRAMLYYFSKRLRLDVAGQFDDDRETPIIVQNRDEFDVALREATQ
jgi:hypothetical protein